jgi:tRNA threonylcarbamoyladenosine biosynthesis protein TsaB
LVENRLVLGIDNSINFLNVALSLESSLIEERCIKSTLPPSQVLPGHVTQMLAGHGYTIDNLALVAVTLGPGSFTGMRVAIAFAKGLSTGRGIPLIGVPTLDVLAAPFSFMEGHYILPLIDAKKGEVFHALYHVSGGDMDRLTNYGAIKPKGITDAIKKPCLIFGTGARLCEEYLSGVEGVTVIRDGFAAVSAGGLIKEALKRSGPSPSEEMQPIYGRRSEAEIKFNVTVT